MSNPAAGSSSNSKALLGACPRQSGELRGFRPEFRAAGTEDEFKPVPLRRVPRHLRQGMPHPLFGGDVLSAIDLYGNGQAWALGYWMAAFEEANGREVEIRVQEYVIVYDIKATKVEAPNTKLTDAGDKP